MDCLSLYFPILAQATPPGEELPKIAPLLTLLPPVVAIALAVITRQVLLSLFCGVWIGAWILEVRTPIDAGLFECVVSAGKGLLRGLDTYVVNAIADQGHAHILLFSLALAGMVNVLHVTGGIRGLVQLVSRLAKTTRSGQVATSLLGTLIFFDDYSNTLIVGNTMRPFTDRVRISREKLSFLVDSTAAPVATIGILSTWTAYQIGLIGDILPEVGSPTTQPYIYYLHSLPYSFYSIFMLVLVFTIASSLRDFGPMRAAELRCRETGKVLRDGASPLVSDTMVAPTAVHEDSDDMPARPLNAIVPITCLLIFTIISLYTTGVASLEAAGVGTYGLRDIIGNADAYKALLWSGYGATAIALGMGLFQGYELGKLLSSWVDGARALVLAIMILILAWSISSICRELETGKAIISLTPESLSLGVIPAVTFVIAGVVALSTGTSFGTMGILIPILFPLVYRLGSDAGLSAAEIDHIGHASLAAVLGGSVFGDHCSPISDTTVLSSMSAGADHVDHVRTQLPYAMLVGALAIPAYLLVGFGVSIVLVHALCLAALIGAFFVLSRRKKSWPAFRTQ